MKKLLTILGIFLVSACTMADLPGSSEIDGKKAGLRQIAQAAKDKGDFDSAARLQQQIIALDTGDSGSFITLAKTLRKMGKKTEMLELLQEGEKLNPEDEKLQLEVARALIENDRPDEAIVKLTAIKTLRNKDYYNFLGVAYDMAGKHKDAQTAFGNGLKIAHDNGLLLNNLALSYILDKQPLKGIDILKTLVKRKDATPKYRQNLALAYGVVAKPDEARELLMQDLSKKDAEDNLKFYKDLRAKR